MMKKKSSTVRLLSAAFLLGSTVCLAFYGWKEGMVHSAVEDREDVDREDADREDVDREDVEREAGAALGAGYTAEGEQENHENAGSETTEHLPLTTKNCPTARCESQATMRRKIRRILIGW